MPHLTATASACLTAVSMSAQPASTPSRPVAITGERDALPATAHAGLSWTAMVTPPYDNQTMGVST